MTCSGVKPSNWTIDYLGWSGFHIHRPKGPNLYIDPPKGTTFPDRAALTLFITHGHPEHLGGALDLVRDSTTEQSITIIASNTVCTYLAGKTRRAKVDFISVMPGHHQELAPGLGFETFQWQHMPLLPPGFGAAARHILHMLRGFRAAWRIIRMSLKGPKGPGLMLGYLLHLPGGDNIIIYGEGLHRHSRAADVAAVGRKASGATLLVASEPEDIAELPRLVAASGAAEAILYEPHRIWRDMFALSHVDMKALKKAITDAGVNVRIPAVNS